MSKRAEQRALKAYPEDIQLFVESREEPGKWLPVDENLQFRYGYERGYERAEKDMIHIVKTWLSEIHRVCDITDENGYRIELRNLIASFKKTLEEEQ